MKDKKTMNKKDLTEEEEENKRRWKAFDESPDRRGSGQDFAEEWAAWDESPDRRGG